MASILKCTIDDANCQVKAQLLCKYMVKTASKLKPIGVRFTEQQQVALAEIGLEQQLSFGKLVVSQLMIDG